MEQVQIVVAGQERRGYSASLKYDKNGVSISTGGDTRIDGGPVILINDEFLSIVLYDEVAKNLCFMFLEARGDDKAMDKWAKACVKKMYEYAYKDRALLKRVAKASYDRGFRDGDNSRTYKIQQALCII